MAYIKKELLGTKGREPVVEKVLLGKKRAYAHMRPAGIARPRHMPSGPPWNLGGDIMQIPQTPSFGNFEQAPPMLSPGRMGAGMGGPSFGNLEPAPGMAPPPRPTWEGTLDIQALLKMLMGQAPQRRMNSGMY